MRSRLFVISYVPLFAIIALRAYPSPFRFDLQGVVFLFAALLCLVGILDTANLLRGARRTVGDRMLLRDIEDAGGSAAGYLVSYLFPFVAASYDSWAAIASYALYFTVLFVIFVRSQFGLINPTLYVFGWRVIQASTWFGLDNPEERRLTVLCKRVPSPGTYRVVHFAGGYLLTDEAQKAGE